MKDRKIYRVRASFNRKFYCVLACSCIFQPENILCASMFVHLSAGHFTVCKRVRASFNRKIYCVQACPCIFQPEILQAEAVNELIHFKQSSSKNGTIAISKLNKRRQLISARKILLLLLLLLLLLIIIIIIIIIIIMCIYVRSLTP